MNNLKRLVGPRPTNNSECQQLIGNNTQDIEAGFFEPIDESCVEKVKRLSLRAINIGSAAGLATLTTYFTYNNIKDIVKYGASSPIGIISIVLLSIEVTCICAASLCIIKIRHLFPLLRHHQEKALDTKAIDDEKKCLPLIQNCFTKMEEYSFFAEWLKIENYENSAAAETAMWNHLKKGMCAGHALDLLTQMMEHSNDKSEDLVKRMDIEKVIYFQILEHIICTIFRDRGKVDSANLILSSPIRQGDILAINNRLSWHLQQYDTDDINIINKEIILHINEDADFMREKFLKCVAFTSSKDKVLAGTISLLPKNLDESYHALFFQCGGGFYRYYDSSSNMPGFFEFRDINTFFETLVKHVKKWGTRWGTDSEKWEELVFKVLFISKKEKLDSKKGEAGAVHLV